MTVDTPAPGLASDVAYPISVELYEPDNSAPVSALQTDVVGSRSFQVALNIADSGSVQVPVLFSDEASTTTNTEATALTVGRVLRFSLGGTEYSAQRIPARRQTSIDSERNEDAQRRSVNTKGLLSEWGLGVLPPHPAARLFSVDTRVFGWMSAENDISAMDTPDFLDPLFAAGAEHPEPWVDLFTIAYDASTHQYFWFDLELASPMSVGCHVGFETQGIAYVNGMVMGQGEPPPGSSWPRTRHGGARLTAGTHRFAWRVQGLTGSSPKLAVVCFEIADEATGRIDAESIQFRSGYVTGTTPYDEWRASSTPGGCTPISMVKAVLAQVQAEQDVLDGWTVYDPADDGTLDANENAFDLIAEHPSTIGMKLDDWLISLAAVHCDIEVDVEGKQLRLYRWRERGTFHEAPTTAPTFSGEIFGAVTGRTPNIVSLTHEERQP
jgi:hypothetical protein